MNSGQSSCILCFQIIEFKKNLYPDYKYYDKEYKQTLFDCCNRLLGVKIESLNCKFSLTNCSPFCLTCFQSSEELWQIEEKTKKTNIKKELDNYVETFTGNVLQCRLLTLSQKFSSTGSKFSDDELEAEPCSDLPLDQLNDILNCTNDEEINLEIVKEEVDFIEKSFESEHEHSGYNDGFDVNSEISTYNKHCSFENGSNNKLEEIKSSLPELRVSLQRLLFDDNGNPIRTMCTNKRVRRENETITSQTPSLVYVKRSSLERNCRRRKIERPLRYRDDGDTDYEYSEEYSSSESEESEDDKFRNSKPKRKNRGRRSIKKMKTTTHKKEKLFNCSVCLSSFSFARQLDYHSKESGHVNVRPFKCAKCSNSFYIRKDLTYHKCCNYQSKKCNYCDKVCKSLFSYYAHVRTHDERKKNENQLWRNMKNRFKCVVCSLEFKFTRKFHKHLKQSGHVNIPSIQCTQCPRKFYNDLQLKNHEFNVHEDFSRNCPLCNEEVIGRFKYWHHVNLCRKFKEDQRNEEKIYNCTRCKKSFTSEEDLLDHRKIHPSHDDSERHYKCDKCRASFFTSHHLARHKGRHLIKSNIQCQICLRFYTNKVTFEKHMKTHTNDEEKIFECNLCDKNFKVFQDLIAHQIIDHELQSPFLCKHCKQTFNYKDDLRLHLKSVHNQKQTLEQAKRCHFCGKVYRGPKSLLLHLFSHTNFSKELVTKYILPTSVANGTFRCEGCGRTFATIYTLHRHGREDNSDSMTESNSQCQECDKVFPFKCALVRHMREAHSTSTVYVDCNVCGKKLASKKLKRHLRTHDRKYVCDICGYRFSLQERLTSHIKLIHEQNKKPRFPILNRTSPKRIRKPKQVRSSEINGTDCINTNQVKPSKVKSSNNCLKSLPQPSITNKASTKIIKNIKNVTCHICRSKIHPGKIKRHLIEHVKRFVCEICGCRFGKRTDLKLHAERTHLQNKKSIPWWKKLDRSVRWTSLARKSNSKRKSHLKSKTFSNVKPHSNKTVEVIFKTSTTTEKNICLQSSPFTANNLEDDENSFDNTHFEDAAADYDDFDGYAKDAPPILLDQPIKQEYPSEVETPNNYQHLYHSANVPTGTVFRELKILVERLQFDSEGNVIRPMCTDTGRRLRKRKAAILARSHLIINDDDEYLSGDEKRHTSRRNDDGEFIGGDLSSDSNEGEEDDEEWERGTNRITRKTNDDPFRKRKLTELRKKYRSCKPYERKPVKKVQSMFSKFKCTVCLLVVNTWKDFRGHLEITGHVSIPSFECQKCNTCYHRLLELRVHEKVYHKLEGRANPPEEKPFKCDKCKATFSQEKHLLSHKEDHLVETNVQCNICYLFYKNQNSFRVHKFTMHKLEYNKFERRREGHLKNPVLRNKQLMSTKFKCRGDWV